MRYFILFIALWAFQFSATGQGYVIINDPVYGGQEMPFPDTTFFIYDDCYFSPWNYYFDLDQDSSADIRFDIHCYMDSEGGSDWLKVKPLGNFQVIVDTNYMAFGQYIGDHMELHDTLYQITVPYKFQDGDTIAADMVTDTNLLLLYADSYTYIPFYVQYLQIRYLNNDTAYIAFKKTDGDETWIYYMKIYFSTPHGFHIMTLYSNESIFGIGEPLKHKNYIYPNPVRNMVSIRGDFEKIEIFSLQGALLLSKEISARENTVDLSWLAQGFYFVRLKNASGEVVQKIIKN